MFKDQEIANLTRQNKELNEKLVILEDPKGKKGKKK